MNVVRKHRAPNGALRREWVLVAELYGGAVRKHRAPEGALRRLFHNGPDLYAHGSESTERQKVH